MIESRVSNTLHGTRGGFRDHGNVGIYDECVCSDNELGGAVCYSSERSEIVIDDYFHNESSFGLGRRGDLGNGPFSF